MYKVSIEARSKKTPYAYYGIQNCSLLWKDRLAGATVDNVRFKSLAIRTTVFYRIINWDSEKNK